MEQNVWYKNARLSVQLNTKYAIKTHKRVSCARESMDLLPNEQNFDLDKNFITA
jgi:hypothetical protein